MGVHELNARSRLPFRQDDVILLARDGPITPMLAVAIYYYCVVNKEVSSEEYSTRHLTQITSDKLAYYLHIRDRKSDEKVVLCIRKKDGRVYDPISGFWVRRGYVNTSKANLQALFKAGTNIEEVYKILGEPAKIEWGVKTEELDIKYVTLISYLTRTGWSGLAFINNKLIDRTP